MTYTVRQAAQALGVAYSTVTYHCRKLDLPKHGAAWLIDDAGLERIRTELVGRCGRPWHKERGDDRT
jgi:hypothetical protein